MKKPENHTISRFLFCFDCYSAEEEGFEPPEPCGSTVFKTAAFDRSATPLFNYLQTVILGVQMYRIMSFCQIPPSTFSFPAEQGDLFLSDGAVNCSPVNFL